MATLSFSVPGIPPSVNAYVRHTRNGRHYVTAEATSFKATVAVIAAGRKVVAKRYSVRISITLGPKQKGDIDNFCKCALDALTEAGVIRSDAAVDELMVVKSRGPQAMTEFSVEEL